jgi:hypothetical protein
LAWEKSSHGTASTASQSLIFLSIPFILAETGILRPNWQDLTRAISLCLGSYSANGLNWWRFSPRRIRRFPFAERIELPKKLILGLVASP